MKWIRAILWIAIGALAACAAAETPHPTPTDAPANLPSPAALATIPPIDALTIQPGKAAFLNSYADW